MWKIWVTLAGFSIPEKISNKIEGYRIIFSLSCLFGQVAQRSRITNQNGIVSHRRNHDVNKFHVGRITDSYAYVCLTFNAVSSQ